MAGKEKCGGAKKYHGARIVGHYYPNVGCGRGLQCRKNIGKIWNCAIAIAALPSWIQSYVSTVCLNSIQTYCTYIGISEYNS